MCGVTWPWNVRHMSWILNKDNYETKGRRDDHSDGLGNTELLSHWAMTCNQQHSGSGYVVLAKTVMPDQNNHDSVKRSPLLKPSKISSQSLSLRREFSYGMHLQKMIRWCPSGLAKNIRVFRSRGAGYSFMFLVLPLTPPGTH